MPKITWQKCVFFALDFFEPSPRVLDSGSDVITRDSFVELRLSPPGRAGAAQEQGGSFSNEKIILSMKKNQEKLLTIIIEVFMM